MFDIKQYVKTGIENTLLLKNGTNLSHQGQSIRVYTGTLIDRFFVGDFSSASYIITASLSSNKKDVIEVLVTARAESASIAITGRSRLDDELITLEATVNNSYFELSASITDPAYAGTEVIFFANYAETFGELAVAPAAGTLTSPSAYTDSVNVKFLPTLSNTGFKSPNFTVNTDGDLTVGTISATTIDASTVTVNGNSVLTITSSALPSTVTTSSLTTLGTLTGLDLNGDLTVRNGTTNYITVTSGQIVIENRAATFGEMNGLNIGETRPGTGKFTSLTSDTLTFISGTGNIDGIIIGNTTPADGTFNNLNGDAVNASSGSIGTITSTEITSDNVLINNEPTLPTHAARKSYVDTKATALAVALGS